MRLRRTVDHSEERALQGRVGPPRRVRQVVRPIRSRILMFAAESGVSNTYKLRRYRSAPELCVNFARDERLHWGQKAQQAGKDELRGHRVAGQKTADG